MINRLWRAANQREIGRLEKWVEKSLMKFIIYKELHIAVEAQGRLSGKQLCILDLSILVDKKLNVSQQGTFVRICNCIVSHSNKGSASRLREVSIPQYSSLVRQHLEYCAHFGILYYVTGMNKQEWAQRMASRMIRDLECKKRLQQEFKRLRQLGGFRPKWRRLNED